MYADATLVTRSLRYSPCSSSAIPETLLCSDGQLFLRFQLVPHRKHSLSQLVFLYRHLFLPFPFVPHKEHSIIKTSGVHVFTHNTVIFCTISTKFSIHLKFCENPSGGRRILPVHGQTGRMKLTVALS